MKSKKWLISMVLAVVLVIGVVLPGCTTPVPAEYWYTPGGEKITFKITGTESYSNVALQVVTDLQDLGLDVSLEIIDSTTYYDYLLDPAGGGMQTFVSGEDPSPDPWSDWIWCMLSDPTGWGAYWNPCWYNDPDYNQLWVENYLAPNLTAKKEILYEMQEILAEDLPVIYLTRDDIITVRRTDTWDNWFNEMGGYVDWINEYSIREVTNLTADDQLRIATPALVDNLNMNQEELLRYTNMGCLYLMLVYENLAFYPKESILIEK